METKFLATAIGSMPFEDPKYAVEVSLKRLKDAPIWPQLPVLGVTEQMETQYSENMPCAIVDYEKSRMYFDTSVDYSEAFAEFYENYMAASEAPAGEGDFSSMAISPKFSKGIYALEEALKAKGGPKLPFVKVQVTGGITIALSVVDEKKRAMFYNEEFQDVIVKAIEMKARWQIQKFQPYAEKVICFIDEPIFSGFGSSTYVSVSREDVVERLRETVDAVHAENALAGVHCCGNTEWSILIDAGVDIVNFDAFAFAYTVNLFADKVKMHLERGGMLAWGIVPTSQLVRDQTVESLEEVLEKGMDELAATGISKDLITKQAILTPACGTGSLDIADAEKVFELLEALSAKMKAKYGY